MSEPRMVSCGEHGERRVATIVCRHHAVVRDRPVGFIENSDDPNNLQAWCNDCEALFLEEGEITDRFRQFCDIAVVCIECYESFKAFHGEAESA